MIRSPAIARITLALLTVPLATFTFAYRYLTYAGFPNDHFIHLTTAQQITMGALPVRDFVERGLPLMSTLSAGAQILFGPGLHAELLLVSAAFAAAAVTVLAAATWISRSLVAGLLAALASVLAFPASYAYPKALAYGVAICAAALYSYHPSGLKRVALALSVVAAFLLRHDHGVLLAFGALVLLVVRHGIGVSGLRQLAAFLALLALAVAPYLAWVQVYQGLGPYASDGLAFSQREAQRATWWELPRFALDRSQPLVERVRGGPVINVRWDRTLPDPMIARRERAHRLTRLEQVGPATWQYEMGRWSASAVQELVQDPAAVDTHGINRATFALDVPAPHGLQRYLIGLQSPGPGLLLRRNGTAALFYLCWLLPLVAGVVLILRWRATGPELRAIVLMTVSVGLAMNLTMLRDPLEVRVRDVVVPAVLTGAFVASTAWGSGVGTLSRILLRGAAVLVLFLVVMSSAALGPIHEQLPETGMLKGWSGVRARIAEIEEELAPPRSRTGSMSATQREIVEYMATCTAADQRILTMTFAPDLLFYAGRGFAGGQVAMVPGYFTADAHASWMLRRMRAEDVPLVLMDSDTQHEMAFHYPEVVHHIDNRYQEIGRIPQGSKELILMGEPTRAVGTPFRAGNLPCYRSGAVKSPVPGPIE